MPERSSYAPGTFSWSDLSTTDVDGAKAFYGALFGWTARDDDIPGGGTYTMFFLNGREVAGGSAGAPAQGPPHWNAYVTVASADETAERAAGSGATVVAPPFDVMDAGRMAVFQDPTGAFLSVWEARAHPGARVVNEHGALTWNDLSTRDPETAESFYRDLFGWEFTRVAGGPEPYWSISLGGRRNGGMRTLGNEVPADAPPFWLTYFAVDDTDATIAGAKEGGGTVITGPVAVPAGRFAIIADPQGAVFGVVDGEFDTD